MSGFDSGGGVWQFLPGVSMTEFVIAPDGERVTFAAPDERGAWHVWLAALDRRTSPKQLTSSVAQWPSFGTEGEIYFVAREGGQEFLYRIGPNKAVPQKMNPEPLAEFKGISPRGEWLFHGLCPTDGTPCTRRVSNSHLQFFEAGWGPGNKFLYLRFRDVGEVGGGKTIVIGLPPGKDLPMLPPSGLKSVDDITGLNVVADIDTREWGCSRLVPTPPYMPIAG